MLPKPSWCSTSTRGRFVDANDNAQKFFGLERARLLAVGPIELSPPLQPDGAPSEQRARAYIQQALDGEVPVFEWAHYDGAGGEIICEVRLVRLPSGNRRLVRGSIADISERKRTERIARSPSARCSSRSRATRRCRRCSPRSRASSSPPASARCAR